MHCTDKESFETKGKAAGLVRSLNKNKTMKFEVYSCKQCGKYHIAHRQNKHTRMSGMKRTIAKLSY